MIPGGQVGFPHGAERCRRSRVPNLEHDDQNDHAMLGSQRTGSPHSPEDLDGTTQVRFSAREGDERRTREPQGAPSPANQVQSVEVNVGRTPRGAPCGVLRWCCTIYLRSEDT